MRKQAMLRLRDLTTLLFIHFLVSPCAWSTDETVSQDMEQCEINALLLQSKTTLASLVKRVTLSPPENLPAALFKLNILTRAGMDKEAVGTLKEIRDLAPQFSSEQVSAIFRESREPPQSWAIAQAVVEIFADRVTNEDLMMGSGGRNASLLEHFSESGWSIDQIDAWLTAKPAGIKNFWINERIQFDIRQGRGDAVEKKFEEYLRANPKDVAEATAYIHAVWYRRRITRGAPPATDLSWFAKTVKPDLATDALEIGRLLHELGYLKETEVFYRRAVATELTEKEIKDEVHSNQTFISAETARANIEIRAKERLAECLLQLNQKDEARKWTLEAEETRKANKVRRNAGIASQVLNAPGAIQKNPKPSEKPAGNDPEYWSEQAEAFCRTNDPVREEEALKKGLALTKPQPPSVRLGKGGTTDWRGYLLCDYARFLMRTKRKNEAIALLRKEIAESPANSESTGRAVDLMFCDPSFETEGQPDSDDELLWTWLENRPKWGNTEQRLLERMLKYLKSKRTDRPFTPTEKTALDAYFKRAEKVAYGGDPSIAYNLGVIEDGLGFPRRAIPLLEYAADRTPDKELAAKISVPLFKSVMDAGDWKNAEKIFPHAFRQTYYKTMADEYSNIAVLAAKKGAKEDAMRIWGRVANINLRQTDGLDELVEAGLKNELISFYTAMQKEIPSSNAATSILGILNTHYPRK